MFTQMRFNLKFLGTILFALVFLVGGFFMSNQIALAYTGGGTASIAVDGSAISSGVTVAKSTSHIFTTVLTIDTAGMTLGAASPTFTIPTDFTAPTSHAVATAGDVNADGKWSVVAGGPSCTVDSAPTSVTSIASGRVITVNITADCAVGNTITLTYKGTSNVTMGATQLVVSTTNAGDVTTPTPLTAGSPTITVTEIQATPTLNVYQTTLGSPSGNPQGNIYINGSDVPFLAARDAAIAGTLTDSTTYTPTESSIWGAGGAFGSELFMFSVIKDIPVNSLLKITKSGDYKDISTPNWAPGFTPYTLYYPMIAYTHTTSTTAYGHFTQFDCGATVCTFVTAASLSEDYSGSNPNGSANTPPTDISQTIGFQFKHTVHAEVITGEYTLTGASANRGYQQGTGYTGGDTPINIGTLENTSTVPNPTTVYVDPSYTTTSCGSHECYYDAFPTIQDGITAVATGGTINVADGTYNLTSRIDVTKAVSIIGDIATPSNVVINAPTGGTLQGQNSAFVITSSDVTIRGFRIQGALHGTETVQNAGIYVDDPNSLSYPSLSNITISNNEVTDNGYGIFVHNIRNSTISNNKIYSNKKVVGKESESGVGIVIFGRAEDSNHTHTLTIDNNQVYSNETEGIRVDVESAVGATTFVNDLAINITGNTVYNNGSTIGGVDKYVGIKSSGWSKGVTVSGNEIYGHTGTTISPTSGNAGIQILASKGWSIDNNNIHDNLNGIFFAYSTFDLSSGSHTISNNNIHANVRGISIDDGTEAVANDKNSIYSNNSTAFSGVPYLPYGVYNRETTNFDATNNWWGNASGPGTVGPGTGDKVSINVNFDPWYIDAGKTTLSNSKTLTFNGNENTGGSTAIQTITTDASANLTSNGFTKTGYTFAGWNTLAGGTGTSYVDGASYTMGASNVTLFAQWTANSYTITFNSAGGTDVTAITQDYGTSVTTPTAPTKEGYTFSAWSPVVPGTMGLDQTLTATWTAIPQHHTSGSSPRTTIVAVNTPIVITPAPVGQVLGAEAYNFTLLIRNNSKGNEVIELQKYLIANGYLTGIADGSFGPKTLEGVKKFQTANSLVADGIVGPAARAVLNRALVTPATPADGSGAVSVTYNFGTTNLKNGSHGDAVQELQRFLNNTLGLELVVDGKLGPKTIAVIKQWQGDNGLVADGIIGLKTKALMNSTFK